MASTALAHGRAGFQAPRASRRDLYAVRVALPRGTGPRTGPKPAAGRGALPPPSALSAAAARNSRAPPATATPSVSVSVDRPPLSAWAAPSRLVASAAVAAPPEAVWAALTDYPNLHTFIPSLVENRCLERRARGARLYQVGAQDLAPGVRFTAACTLELTEHLRGAPAAALGAVLSRPGAAAAAAFAPPPPPQPPSSPQQPGAQQAAVHGDILFEAVAGDFEEFRGAWRVARGARGPGSAQLSYVLTVRPQRWLPAGLVAGHIKKQVAANVGAIAAASEARHRAAAASRNGGANGGGAGGAGGAGKQ